MKIYIYCLLGLFFCSGCLIKKNSEQRLLSSENIKDQTNILSEIRSIKDEMIDSDKSMFEISNLKVNEFWRRLTDTVLQENNSNILEQEIVELLEIEINQYQKSINDYEFSKFVILECIRNKSAIDLLLDLSLSKLVLNESDAQSEISSGVSSYARTVLVNYFETFDGMPMVKYLESTYNNKYNNEEFSNLNDTEIWKAYFYNDFKKVINKKNYSFSKISKFTGSYLERYSNAVGFP